MGRCIGNGVPRSDRGRRRIGRQRSEIDLGPLCVVRADGQRPAGGRAPGEEHGDETQADDSTWRHPTPCRIVPRALAAMGVAGAASEPMTVDGIPVSTFTMPAAGPSDTVTGAVFRHGDSVVWVLPMDNSMLIPITTALITANH